MSTRSVTLIAVVAVLGLLAIGVGSTAYAGIPETKLHASDGGGIDSFGKAVAIEGDTAVVGAYQDDDGGLVSGSAYIFVRGDLGDWQQVIKLTPSDHVEGDHFGESVAISGDTVVVGAHSTAEVVPGAAYVFDRQALGT